MATPAENIQTAIDNLSATLATATLATGPSYSIDGQTVNRESYITSLIAQLAALRGELAALSAPYEVATRGIG